MKQRSFELENVSLAMKKRSAFAWPVISLVLFAMPSAGPKACPPCEPGFVQRECRCVKCGDGQFWFQMNGQAKCNPCTTPCTVKQNLIEVTTCTKMTDRRCQCKAGFYCPSPVRQTCRRDCEPCSNGFTKTPNLNLSCQPYMDCASLGMVLIKEGSPFSDRVCGRQPIQHDTPFEPKALYRLNTPYVPDTTTQSLPPSTHKPSSIRSANHSVDVTYVASDPTAPSGLRAEFARTTKEGPVSPSETPSKTTWMILLLLLLALCLVACLFLRRKRRAIKNKLELAGRAFGRYQPVIPASEPNSKTLLPKCDVADAAGDAREARGQGSFPGKNQQVNMEHVGNADGINNTVGSIFIYSPGMVILGSNSSEKKEGAETSGGDAGGDEAGLMSVPQQESGSESDIRTATQEELGKGLTVPVPATSK